MGEICHDEYIYISSAYFAQAFALFCDDDVIPQIMRRSQQRWHSMADSEDDARKDAAMLMDTVSSNSAPFSNERLDRKRLRVPCSEGRDANPNAWMEKLCHPPEP